MNHIESVLAQWEQRLSDIRDELYELGDAAHTNRYNLLATEALSLSVCIADVRKAMLRTELERFA